MPHPLSPAQLNALNLKVLRRHCPQIKDIYDQASYVVLYRSILKNPEDPNSKAREWSKKDVHVEGSMFLVEYDTPPPHGFYILNREGLNDFKHVFRPGDKFEYKSDFIIFQGEGSSEIWGLWIFEEDQRKRLAKKFLYYHQLQVDPSKAVPPPDTPIILPNGKPQPQTVDELFQNLLGSGAGAGAGAGPSSSTGTVTASSTPAPVSTQAGIINLPAGSYASAAGQQSQQTQQARTGRRRGESVSHSNPDSQSQPKHILTASTGPGSSSLNPNATPSGAGQERGKNKKLKRPKSVPPQQQQQQSTEDGQKREEQPVPNQAGIPMAGFAPSGQSTPQPDPTTSLKQLFGLLPGPAPAAPTPPASSLLAQTQAPAPSISPSVLSAPPAAKEKEKEKEKNGHGRKKSAHLSSAAPQQGGKGIIMGKEQYIPQPGLNGDSLVDAEVVKDALVDKLAVSGAQDGAEGAGKGKGKMLSEREFVQEVLRLIHTDKEWVRGLREEYGRRVGDVDAGVAGETKRESAG